LLTGLRGRVVDVGAGDGLNFGHYPYSVEEVIGARAGAVPARARAAGEVPVAVSVRDGLAEALPLENASAEAAVVPLVLRSVESQASALAELRRVLRPGGELRFTSTCAPSGPPSPASSERPTSCGPNLAGGCHTHRDTPCAIEAAGFAIQACRRFRFRPCAVVAPVTPHVLGRARVV
jgi:SAM-dependent methyltransferase